MKFIAEKADKKKVIMVNGDYLIEKDKLPNATQAQMAWKRRKDELRKAGWSITVVNISTLSEKKETSPPPPQRKEKKRKTVRLFGYKAIVEEE